MIFLKYLFENEVKVSHFLVDRLLGALMDVSGALLVLESLEFSSFCASSKGTTMVVRFEGSSSSSRVIISGTRITVAF